MNAVERLSSYISQGVYTFSGPFHPFGGAVDIIVVEQQDGSFKSSPWYVRFGKFQGVLKTREKIVNICVNGVDANFHMYLDHKGEAFFLEEVDVEEGKSMLYTSSLSSGDERDEESSGRRPTKSKSCNFDANGEMPLAPIDASTGKIVPRTSSRRGRLLGLVFGGKTMKQESFMDNENGADIPRIGSLERAEIAADLLEVRWTTSLATKNPKKNKASQFSAEDSLDTKADVDDGKSQTALCVNEDMEDGSDPSHLQEENSFCDGEMSNKSQSGVYNSECSVGEASLEVSCLGAPVETYVLNDINLGEKYELSEISRATNEVTDADHHDNMKSFTSSITCSESQIPDPAELEVGSCEQFNEEAFEERNAILSDHDVLEENEQDRVQSFIYCETSGSSAVGLDGSIKETQETLYLACGDSGGSHVHAETLHETTELISETQVLDIIHQHTITERLVEVIKSEAKPAKVPENQSQHSSPSYSCMPANVVAGCEGSLVMQESYTEMVRVDSKLDSAEETVSHGSFTISSFSDSGHIECKEIIRDEKKKSELQPSLESIGDSQEFDGDFVPTKVMTISPPESSSFSDSGHVQCNEIIRDDKKKSALQSSLESIGDSQEFVGDCVPKKVMAISPPESSSFSDSGHVQCNEIIRDEKKKSELQPSLESIGDSQESDGDCVPTKLTTISPPESSSFSGSGHVQCNEIIREEKKKSELQPSLESIVDSQDFHGDCVPTKVMTISPPASSNFSDSGHIQCNEIIRDEKKKSELQPSLESIGDSQEFDGDCVPTKVMTISPPASSNFSDSGHIQCNEIIRDEKKKSELQPSLESIVDSQEFHGDCVPTKVMTISPPASSNFSDSGHIQCNEIIRDEKKKSELQPSLESIGDSQEFHGDCVPTKVMTISPPASSSFSDSGHVQCNDEIIRDEKTKIEHQPSLESIGDSQEFDGACVPTEVTTILSPESSSFSDSGHVQCNEIIRDEKRKSELQPSLESIGDSQEFDGDCVPTKLTTISPPESSSGSGHVQCNEIIREEIKKSELQPSLESIGDSQEFHGDCVPTKVMTISPPESSDEEQFLFSDLDDMKHSEAQSMDLISLDPVEKENSPSLVLDSNEKIDDLFDANYESYSSPDSSVQENPPDDLDNLIDKSRVVSSPISIPSSVNVTGEEVERLAESLPNMGLCGDDLDAHELHRTISHSLDSNSKSLGWALLRNNISTFTKSNADNKHILVQEQLSIDDTQISRELKNILANPDVEISLCKHLLYEGMGAAAASEAFDAEKLDIDQFASLGPDVLKKDNLVVRIRGHYYPWEAAAPLVLGMLSFGKEQMHQLKGMIAVDQVEKTLEGDPSKAVVASGGSWRLWPFPFRRSRAIPSVQPAIVNTRQSDSENAKETTAGMDGNSSVCKPKLTKKKVRVIAPTSEQLASLNLKEGRNTITFTFSTAMLGKQQVDARIYLWKWNTRIVISDVDGTITKSDVLGQFMPMVGVDWSQTGVAHLFSAIKENGYQLIFLSARSISQAYITRQFLFNLKQDGKALPDGPVVISPDGLFPSLYREVIRRAPHEFKIACLEDIRVLFPSDCNPFYAGFGNRDTDEISYLKVGIPKGKIFIINPKGEVAVNRLVDTKSYTSLHALVNGMFPPTSTSSSEQEDFNSWNYWRLPPLDVDM